MVHVVCCNTHICGFLPLNKFQVGHYLTVCMETLVFQITSQTCCFGRPFLYVIYFRRFTCILTSFSLQHLF